MTADGVANAVGGAAGPAFWYLTLFCGFLVLATSMAMTADGCLRRWVDVFWTASPRLRSRRATSAASAGSPPAELSTTMSGSLPMAAQYSDATSEPRIGETSCVAMKMIDLQRRVAGERADELLDRLQSSVPEDRRVRWNESGHARLDLRHERDDAREYVAAQLDALGDDWTQHIAIL